MGLYNREEVKEGTRFLGCGTAIWAWIVGLVVLGTIISFALNAWLYPWYLASQRNAVKQSQSFVDSQNTNMINEIQEYHKLDVSASNDPDSAPVYHAQQVAIQDSICREKANMSPETVSRDVLTFLSQHGGCG